MFIDNIRFNDSGKKINITIDKETQQIPICSINKFESYIFLQEPLNTPLKENIIVDALLCYIPYDTINEDVETLDNDVSVSTPTIHGTQQETEYIANTTQTQYIYDNNTMANNIAELNGTVDIIIYDDNNIYYNNTVSFYKGHIQDTITNKLSVGEYKAKIIFAGNKYLQPKTLDIDFNIEKRLATFTFTQENYFGYPTENIIVSGQLKDSLTRKPIKNCSVLYDFNGYTYSTTSNSTGNVHLNIDIPDANPMHCLDMTKDEEIDISDNEIGTPYVDEFDESQDFDEDGNIVDSVTILAETEECYIFTDTINSVFSLITEVENNNDVSVKVDTTELTYSIDDNQKIFSLNGIEPGIYNVLISVTQSEATDATDETKEVIAITLSKNLLDIGEEDIFTELNIPKKTSSIEATATISNNNLVISANVNSDASGVILIEINGDNYNTYIANGSSSLTINNIASGYYIINVSYLGDDTYKTSSSTITIQAVNTSTNNESAEIFYLDGQHNDVTDISYDDDTYDDAHSEWDNFLSTSYDIVLYLNSDSYQVENAMTNVIVTKLPTEVTVNQVITPNDNYIGKLIGAVIANYPTKDKSVAYGNIYVSFDDTDYISDTIPVNNGNYSIDIDFTKINDTYNVSEIDEPIVYKGSIEQATITNIVIEESSVEIGEPIIAIATVEPSLSSGYIQDGMVVFILTKDDKEVYRYGTQIDSTGRAIFFFNASVTGSYKVQAFYYGLFGYEHSESSIEEIEVTNNEL